MNPGAESFALTTHPLKAVIEARDRAITAQDIEAMMAFYADDAVVVVRPGVNAVGKEAVRRAFHAMADYYDRRIAVRQGAISILDSGETALVIMDSFIELAGKSGPVTINRRATEVFRKGDDGRWLCVIDNSYGAELLGPA
jgi:uncharacterized protein (TIGR02246 family)